MNEMNGFSLADIRAATEGNNNDGWGNGNGAWFWIVIILLFAWGGFGRGFGGNTGTQDTLLADEFIKRDIFGTNQNVSNTACQTQRDVLENRYTNQLGLQTLQAQMQNCCCEAQKEIVQNRYDTAMQANNLQAQASNNALQMQAQLADCCCKLEAQGLANTQKILDKMCENEINQLRTDLQSAQLQISQLSQTATLTNTLRPFPQPAYITCSPYQSVYGVNGCGCNYGVA